MSAKLSWRHVGMAIIAGVLVTAATALVQVRSEATPGSSCMGCADIVDVGNTRYMGAPFQYVVHYPAGTTDGSVPAYSAVNALPLAGDLLLWSLVAVLVIWYINGKKMNAGRKLK